MSDFITELAQQIWDVELSGKLHLTRPDLDTMVARAAAKSLADQGLAPIGLHREIDPETGSTYHVLVGDGWREILDAHEVATLRAILATYDETRPPQPGDPLSVAMETEDGRVVTEWEEA